jgi:hypothetical protein
MKQLTALCLGTSAEKTDGNSNTFTADGFKNVLRALDTMPKLTALDMQLPHVKQLYINDMGIFVVKLRSGRERHAVHRPEYQISRSIVHK